MGMTVTRIELHDEGFASMSATLVLENAPHGGTAGFAVRLSPEQCAEIGERYMERILSDERAAEGT